MILIDYPGHLVAAGLVLLAAILIVIAYRTEKAVGLKWFRWPLAVLELGAIVILLIIIWNPSKGVITHSRSKNTVLVVFDTSESMSIIDAGENNRLDEAIRIFRRYFKPGHPDRPNYRLYNFDVLCNYRDSVESFGRWGAGTNLYNVLEILGRYDNETQNEDVISEEKVVGAVVFTDGQANNKNVSAYRARSKQSRQNIIFVGMGAVDPRVDVAVKAVKGPGRVAIDTAYKVEVLVHGKDMPGKEITVELRKDDYLIASKKIRAKRGKEDYKVDFLVGADKLGRHFLEVRALQVGDEINLANNIRRVTVNVVEPHRRRVLLYSQVANFDFGKIRSALERDKKIELDIGLDVILSPMVMRQNNSMAGHIDLPQKKEGFYQYDVIVLGPCDFDYLSQEQIEGLYSFVAQRGGGLVLLPGRENYDLSIAENPTIKALLPVEFGRVHREFSGGGGDKAQLTLEGIDSHILSKLDLEEESGEVSAFYNNFYKKPGATILIDSDDMPILCVQRVGRGRVCLINANGLFRWYRQDLNGGVLQKLMSGLTAYLPRVTGREAGVELFAKRLSDNSNKIRFDAYIYDKGFSLVSDATVLLEVGDEILQMGQVDKGHYVSEVENLRDEAVIATAEARLDGVHLGSKTLVVNLPLPVGELDRTELDREFLVELAGKYRADYFDADQVDKYTADVFEVETATKTISNMKSVWQRWPLLVALCMVLSVIWFTRRAKGLI